MPCPPVGQPPGLFDLAAPHAFTWYYILLMGAMLALVIFMAFFLFTPFRLIPPIPGRRTLLWLRAGKMVWAVGAFFVAELYFLQLSAIEAWKNLALAQGCPDLAVTDAWFQAVNSVVDLLGIVPAVGFLCILPLDYFFHRKARKIPGSNILHHEYSIIIKRPVERVFAALASPEQNQGWVMRTRKAQVWRIPEGELAAGTIIQSEGEWNFYRLKARVEITRYEPDQAITLKLLSYKHPHPKAPDLQATITFRVEPVVEGTRLSNITDSGQSKPCSLLQQLEEPPDIFAASLIKSIGKKYLSNIKKQVEKG